MLRRFVRLERRIEKFNTRESIEGHSSTSKFIEHDLGSKSIFLNDPKFAELIHNWHLKDL